jgi:hypothetical protein
MTSRFRGLVFLLAQVGLGAFSRPALSEQTVDLVGNIYCRASVDAGERPWGGVRVFVKGNPRVFGDSDPEHGLYRLTLPHGEVLGRKLTLVFAQSNLTLSEEVHEVTSDDTIILAGQPTAQVAPKVFVNPYCTELQTPKLREMVRSLVDQISHRAAIVHEELVRAHRFGNPETADCLDGVLSRMGAHLRHAESRVPYFVDALGRDAIRTRREVNVIKIADERSLELEKEANFCLEHHASNPGEDSSRYLPDLAISPTGYFSSDESAAQQMVPWNHPRPSDAVTLSKQPIYWAYGTALETGYDTNLLERSRATAIPSWQFRPSAFSSFKYFDPASFAETPNTEQIEPKFVVNLGLSGLILTATEGGRGGLSQYSDLGVTANARANFYGNSPLSGALFGQYVRRIEPSNDPEYFDTFGQNDFRLGGESALKLGGGRFDWGLGYAFGVTSHDSAEQTRFDRYEHRFSVTERLRFLPETALVHDTEYRFRGFSSDVTHLRNSGQLRSRIGILGMIGDRLGFQGLLGWAQSDYETVGNLRTNFDGVIALGKVEWFFGPVAKTAYSPNVLTRPSLGLIFERDYRDHIISDYYLRNRGSIRLALTDGSNLLWMLDAGISKINYPTFSVGTAPLSQSGYVGLRGADGEYRVDASTAVEYRFFGDLRFSGRLGLSKNFSEVVPVTGDGVSANSSLEFVRYQLYAGLLFSR